MHSFWFMVLVVVYYSFCERVRAEEPPGSLYLNAANDLPRNSRSGSSAKNIAEMGDFFKKASKSIPRIGRRNDIDPLFGLRRLQQIPFPSSKEDQKRALPPATWGDLADKYEYNPELFNSADSWMAAVADDPSAYEWGNIRVKRNPIRK